MNAVSLGWVRATNERAPFRVHDAVIAFVDECRDLGSLARVLGFQTNRAGVARAKCEGRRECVIGVIVVLQMVLRDVLLA